MNKLGMGYFKNIDGSNHYFYSKCSKNKVLDLGSRRKAPNMLKSNVVPTPVSGKSAYFATNN